MTSYIEKLRSNLIAKDLHVNDDVSTRRPGTIDRNYDYEEHESYIKIATR